MNEYSMAINEVFQLTRSSNNGLSGREAAKRLEQFGFNELDVGSHVSALKIFLNQFKNAFIVLLIFAGVLSLFIGDEIEAAAIFGILLLNTMLGFFQEYKAERAIEALEKIAAPMARVVRDGRQQVIPAREVVFGDIVLLEAGDIVPADCRLIEVSSLQIDEASLTGESVPSKKISSKLGPRTQVADQENMAFMSTNVTYGKGKGLVTGIGMKTEFGKIAITLQKTEETQTPLQAKFGVLAKQLGAVGLALIIIVLTLGTMQGTKPFSEMVLVALALTVSTIPNSLPVIVTVGLSMGAQRLAKKNMLIKKLPAAESLGAATIICSDKTGTITKNEMTATDIFFNGQNIRVSGTGYEPKGSFSIKGREISHKKLELLLRIGYLCNNAKLVKNEGSHEIIGDPTEGALVVLGKKAFFEEDDLKHRFTFVKELPFDSDRKRMTVIARNNINKKIEAYVKGAPDLVLKHCNRIYENGRVRAIKQKDREIVIGANNSFGEKALRVLALAYREIPPSSVKYGIKEVEQNLIFVGLVGMIDPPREEVAAAVEKCKAAGIRVMIITGDHAVTTTAVAKQVGLFEEGDIVLTGEEIEKMSNEEIESSIDRIRIIARAMPILKSRIVDALQKKGHVVAMTGDGVNDAPALKKADIGIAMGTGTLVAKEVSKAILVDDNFASIVNAIEEGRNIYNKMIRSARYLLSCNCGEITSVFIAILLNFPLPLLPLQILLMNLLTDDFPALGLGFEKNEEGIMQRPPRNPKERPINTRMLISILVFGLIMSAGTLYVFSQYKDVDLVHAQTMAFTTLVMFQLFAVMSSRTLYYSPKALNPLTNKWIVGAVLLSLLIQFAVIYLSPLQTIFGTTGLSIFDWLEITAISFLGFLLMEASKFAMGKSVVIRVHDKKRAQRV